MNGYALVWRWIKRLGIFSAVSTGVTSLVLATSTVALSPASRSCLRTNSYASFCFVMLATCNRSQTSSFCLVAKSTLKRSHHRQTWTVFWRFLFQLLAISCLPLELRLEKVCCNSIVLDFGVATELWRRSLYRTSRLHWLHHTGSLPNHIYFA